ncbi:shikimate kinase [Clostridium sp. CTA-5]
MKNRIVIIGMPGCGKTTIGRMLAEKLSMKFYDMDEYIENMTSKTISELFEKGENRFRDIETLACRQLVRYNNVLISTGGGIIKRNINIDILKEEALIIFLDRPIEKILSDIDISKRPLLKEGKEKLLKLHKQRYELYKKAADEIIINDGNIEDVIIKFKDIINSNINSD